MTFINDIQNTVVGGVDIKPGTQQSGDGTVYGTGVDLDDSIGAVHAIVLIGDSADYADYDVQVKLQEYDGANWNDVDGTRVRTVSLGTGSAGQNDGQALLLTQKNRRYKRVRTAVTISGTEASSGATPTVDVAAYVFAQKERF